MIGACVIVCVCSVKASLRAKVKSLKGRKLATPGDLGEKKLLEALQTPPACLSTEDVS